MRDAIKQMSKYVPGFQPPDGEQWIKLNTNENPYPPSPQVAEAIRQELGDGGSLRKYPDPPSQSAREAAADLYGYDPDWIIMANGSDELLNNLIRTFVGEGEELAYLNPSYSYYATLAAIQGAKVKTFTLTEEGEIADFPERYRGKLFFLTSPNAPLGISFDNDRIAELAGRCDGVLVVDEAYADFAEINALDLVGQHDNVIVTRTFSKSYGLAGMRLGLAIARPEVVDALDKIRDHYNIDRLAQVAAVAALKDQDYLQDTVQKICATRQWFAGELETLGYALLPSQANYVFAIPPDRNGKRVYDALFERKILVRFFSDPALAHGLRISIGTREEMETSVAALKEIG
ncbi:MAG: histidinol-phosphate transaminase [Desulfuromonas sp.]|nr:MAG: histidinol-phosphate transaminase [Desulfuromonas sp.]